MEDLYSSLLEGGLSLRLPIDMNQRIGRTIALGRLSVMPVQQHMQLQVNYPLLLLTYAMPVDFQHHAPQAMHTCACKRYSQSGYLGEAHLSDASGFVNSLQ